MGETGIPRSRCRDRSETAELGLNLRGPPVLASTVIYRSKPHATLKRNYQLMLAIKWLRLLMNHIPDRHEYLVRYYGDYSNRARGARRLIENGDGAAESVRVDEPPADTRRKANWARLIQKVYEVDPLECASCGSNMRIIAFIDATDAIERIVKHLNVWDPPPNTLTPKSDRFRSLLSADPEGGSSRPWWATENRLRPAEFTALLDPFPRAERFQQRGLIKARYRSRELGTSAVTI